MKQTGWTFAVAIAGMALVAPSRAAACGGFFCQSAPMDQAGENILFSVEDDGTLVTHVQILYSGDADAFAWILPLPSVPTSIGVGSDALFQQLAARTAPQFGIGAQRTEGTCRPTPSCPYDDYYDTAAESPGPPRASGGAADAAATGGVTVYLRETVGPYDAVVLGSGSGEELFLWLDENGYDIPEISRPIVGEYVAARHVFVAVRLVSGADTREIQPLVLRYREAQPCVPMRLTAIATVPDMPIVAYFAAGRLATPNNYVRLEPSYDDPRLWQYDPSYRYVDYVSNLVDDAGGRAWVTEYAGDMPAVALALPSVEELRTLTDPSVFVQRLQSLGFQGDSQLLGILMRFLPPPEAYASSPQAYYNCLWSSWMSAASCGYEGGFDPDGLVTALTEQIVEPRREAQAILDRQPKLTRLYTTMSAEDMTVDPTFVLDEGLPAVSNLHLATIVTECSGEYFEWSAPQRIELPSGRTAQWREGVGYPGTDAAYCEDMRTGAFSPWATVETRRATAERRAITPGGGGLICSAGMGSGSAGALLVVGLALALGITRRRLR